MGLMAFLCPLPTLIYLGYHAIRLCGKRPGRREGLAVFDEALGLKDRLQTADEFLGATKRTPFMDAAIEDAKPAMEQASRTSLDWSWGNPWSELKRLAAMSALALILLLAGVFLPTFLRSASGPQPAEGGMANTTAQLPAPLENTPTDPEQPPITPVRTQAGESGKTGAQGYERSTRSHPDQREPIGPTGRAREDFRRHLGRWPDLTSRILRARQPIERHARKPGAVQQAGRATTREKEGTETTEGQGSRTRMTRRPRMNRAPLRDAAAPADRAATPHPPTGPAKTAPKPRTTRSSIRRRKWMTKTRNPKLAEACNRISVIADHR